MRTPRSMVQWGTPLAIDRFLPFCLRRNSRVAVWNASVFPSASKPMILGKLIRPHDHRPERPTDLSADTPPTKHMTQGKTRTPSFSTNHGTFSTNTRMKSVEKYLGARA